MVKAAKAMPTTVEVSNTKSVPAAETTPRGINTSTPQTDGFNTSLSRHILPLRFMADIIWPQTEKQPRPSLSPVH